MKCPNCQSNEFQVYESRGFTSQKSPIKECDCGHVWRLVPLHDDSFRIDVIKHGGEVTISLVH
jgi:transcriptional regulator NrdR family protein